MPWYYLGLTLPHEYNTIILMKGYNMYQALFQFKHTLKYPIEPFNINLADLFDRYEDKIIK